MLINLRIAGNLCEKSLIESLILTGFGYGNLFQEEIDLVYPKVAPSKEKIEKLIYGLLNKSLDKFKKEDTEEDNSYLIKIDNLLESLKDNDSQQYGGVEQGEVEETSNNYEEKEVVNSVEKKMKYKKSTKFVDILLILKFIS